jgi:hypothetical protein
LIIGDSLVRQASLSIGVGVMAPGVETLVEAVNTSGLVSGAIHWDARADELIASFRPTVVLISFAGNFTAPFWDGYAPPGAPGSVEYQGWIGATVGSNEFLTRYTAAAISLTARFQSGGARVAWLEAPPFPPEFANPTVPDRLWARWKDEIPAARPDTRMLSARAAVADANGNWMQYKVICGTNLEIRSREWDGGVHFTADGAGSFGRAVARSLSQAEGWPAPQDHCPGLSD